MSAAELELVITRLRSGALKEREAGLKLLKSRIEVDDFCSLLDENSRVASRVAGTSWAGLLRLLCECIGTYADRKNPNTEYARLLKSFVQRGTRSGYLRPSLKSLYQHIIDILKKVPKYEAEYGSILSHILPVPEYRAIMSSKLYGELLDTLANTNSCVPALLSAIAHPPVDVPDNLRPSLITSLSRVFCETRDSMNFKRALDSAIKFLRHDGPNLGTHLMQLHGGITQCFERLWPAVHDVRIKECYVLYLRMQLNLRTVLDDHLEGFIDFVQKEIEAKNWAPAYLVSFLHLAASVVYEVLKRNASFSPRTVKRLKKAKLHEVLKENIKDGKPLWIGAVCILMRKYGSSLPSELLTELLEALISCLGRLTNEVIKGGTNEAPLWTIRCLCDACHGLVPSVPAIWHNRALWQSIWDAVTRRLLVFEAEPSLMEESLKLLGCLAMKNLVVVTALPIEIWNLRIFKEPPSRNAIFFVAALFSTYGSQVENLELRKCLLCWCLTSLSEATRDVGERVSPEILSAAILAVSTGLTGCKLSEVADKLNRWSDEEERHKTEVELHLLDQSEEYLTSFEPVEATWNHESLISFSVSEMLLQLLADDLQKLLQAVNMRSIIFLFDVSTVVLHCIYGLASSRRKRARSSLTWSLDGTIYKELYSLLQGWATELQHDSSGFDFKQLQTNTGLEALQELASASNRCSAQREMDGFLETLLKALVQLDSSPDVDGGSQESAGIVDHELDAESHLHNSGGRVGNILISIVSRIGEVLPQSALAAYKILLQGEDDVEVRGEIVLSMCNIFSVATCLEELRFIIQALSFLLEDTGAAYSQALQASNILFSKLRAGKERVKSQYSEDLFKLVKLVEEAPTTKFEWHVRCKLGCAIAAMILFDPTLAEAVTSKFMDLLHDGDFRVRKSQCRLIPVLFETWNGDHELLQDIYSHLGVKLPMVVKLEVVSAAEACQSPVSQKCTWTKTAVLCLGEIALVSQSVETEAIFSILAQAALEPALRTLAVAIIDRIAKTLGYADRWKYLEQLIRGICSSWIIAAVPLSALMEIRDILVSSSDAGVFLQSYIPFLLPYLLLHDKVVDLQWLAQGKGTTVKDLVVEHFACTFAVLSTLHQKPGHGQLTTVQGALLTHAELTAAEKDYLVKKTLVTIVSQILLLVSAAEEPYPPDCTKHVAKAGIKYVLDELLESDDGSSSLGLVNVFRPDCLFQILLKIQKHASNASHVRHRRHYLAKLETILEILDTQVSDPGTFRYLLHMILHSLDVLELQERCCCLISQLVDKLDNSRTMKSTILGQQLRAIVSQLVCCSIESYSSHADKEHMPNTAVNNLLRQLTADADESLQEYMKDLDPFPNTPPFKEMRSLQLEFCSTNRFGDDFVEFVRRAPFLPSHQRLWSLRSFCNLLREKKLETGMNGNLFFGDEVVIAVWELVLLCNEEEGEDMRNLTAEFLAAAGIADTDALVFQLPNGDKNFLIPSSRSKNLDSTFVSKDFVRAILSQLCNYLIDKDIDVIELASGTVKGILATFEGQEAFRCLQAAEQSYLKAFGSLKPDEKIVQSVVASISQHISCKPLPPDDSSLWSTHGKSYETWISTLVYSLVDYADHPIIRLCQGLAFLKAAFAEFVLPHVLGSLSRKLQTTSKLYKIIVSQVREQIFSDSNRSTRSIQVFLEALNVLRSCYVDASRAKQNAQKTAGESSQEIISPSSWPKVYWLDVDYIHTARSAQKCAAYFTSLLYVEHWCELKYGSLTLGDPQLYIDNELPEHVELLLSIYTKVNEPDGVYGIVHAYKPTSQVKLYEHEGDWGKALLTYDLLLKSSSTAEARSSYTKGIMKALHHVGCSQLNELLCSGLTKTHEPLLNDLEFRELQYQSAWRAGKWAFDIPISLEAGDCGFHEKLHRSFKFLLEGDPGKFHPSIKQMRVDVVSHVVRTSLESTQNVYPAIIKLQIVDCLSQAWDLRWPSCLPEPVVPSDSEMRKILTYSKGASKLSKESYDLREPFSAFLNVLFPVLERADLLPLQLLEQATQARKAGQVNHATLALQELKTACGQHVGIQDVSRILTEARIEEAKVLWSQGQQDMAVKLLKFLLNQSHGGIDFVDLYCLTGKWLAQTRSASSRAIMEDYLQKSVQVAEAACTSASSSQKLSRAHYHLAHFAHSLYRNFEARLSSSEWSAAKNLRSHKKREYADIMAKLKTAKRDQEGLQVLLQKARELKKQNEMDDEEENRLKADKHRFLCACLGNYRSCLLTSDKYDIRVVFRIVSLWFNLSSEPEVVQDMLESAEKVPSYKFLPLVYQIASRMGGSRSDHDFPSAVALLVKKMAIEHPYHTLYQIFALANGDRIKRSQKSKNAFVFDMEKKHAAQEILSEIASKHNRELIKQVKQMAEMYIKLAELEFQEGEPRVVPREIQRVGELQLVPVITADIPVDRSCNYGGLAHFRSFKREVMVMHGVNVPKVIECESSDGFTYRQLAKSGDDDLRQDAVMEQLFGLVNTLLKDHSETRKRRLQVRTYKVIPFTPSAGALEWVLRTVPLAEYLVGKDGGAHARYRPLDWDFAKCRKYMHTEKDKSAAFQTVCQNLAPVMRFFFLEKFKQAADWFEKRLAYTRSVATSSMVGYIIGLGDRHAMNILIDQQSAEVVHIDLGVAFEQGRMLRTPETIPFRLTRDIVDGMGVTGVEGVFRRCSEATLKVMRANKEALLTIVEVFIHDPLYKWALSPLKAVQRQKEVNVDDDAGLDDLSDEGNRDAARALMRVKHKLDGYEGDEMRTVEGQVHQLIQDAQDPERLALLFPGWSAWL